MNGLFVCLNRKLLIHFFNGLNLGVELNGDVGLAALTQQHVENISCTLITEELTMVAFMIGDLVLLHHRNKVPLSKTAQC